MPETKEASLLVINIYLLQFLFYKNTVNLKECMAAMLFYNKKRAIIEWMAVTGFANKLNTFEKRDNCRCLFQRNTVP